MKIRLLKKLVLLIIMAYLTACADTTPPPKSFNQFLFNQASMTKQLESLDQLKVVLLFTGTQGSVYKRVVSLNLKDKPVIVGVSQTKLANKYFVDLLKSADTKPIGKILFAENSPVKRDLNMQVEQVYLDYISDSTVREYIRSLGYNNKDEIYKRTSIFRNGKETMQLDEYILPSIHNWLPN